EIDLVGVGARVLAIVRVPAVHLEGAHAGRAGGRLEVAALADLRVLREGEFGHLVSSGNRESRIGCRGCGAWYPSMAGDRLRSFRRAPRPRSSIHACHGRHYLDFVVEGV